MFDVFTSATGTIGTYPTLDKAVVAAKKLGRTAQIFNTNNPFKVVKHVCPIGGVCEWKALLQSKAHLNCCMTKWI